MTHVTTTRGRVIRTTVDPRVFVPTPRTLDAAPQTAADEPVPLPPDNGGFEYDASWEPERKLTAVGRVLNPLTFRDGLRPPPRRVELLVCCLGFGGDPEHPALAAVLAALDPCVRYHAPTHTQYALHVALDGFDLEAGEPGEAIDVPKLAGRVGPKVVLLVTGPEQDPAAAARHVGWCVHRHVPVYHHDTEGRHMVAWDVNSPRRLPAGRESRQPAPADPLSPRAARFLNQEPERVTKDEPYQDEIQGGRLVGKWFAAKLGDLHCSTFREWVWPLEDQVRPGMGWEDTRMHTALRDTPCLFGECVFWSADQARKHGLDEICHEWVDEATYLDEEGRDLVIKIRLSLTKKEKETPEAIALLRSDPAEYRRLYGPLSLRHVRDDYWREQLASGILYGEYKQRVRQYVERVIGPTPDGLEGVNDEGVATHIAAERMAIDDVVAGPGVPDCWGTIDRTGSGYWDHQGAFVNTGAVESVPRHWVDFSAFLRGPKGHLERRRGAKSLFDPTGDSRRQDDQHGAFVLKPWFPVGDDTELDEVEDEDVEFVDSITAWQDEYDDIGSWSHDATAEERERFRKRMRRALTRDEAVADRAARLGRQRCGHDQLGVTPSGRYTSAVSRGPDHQAAWLEHLLDATDSVRGLVPLVETCGVAESVDLNETTVATLEAELERLGGLPRNASAWLREHAAPVWDDFVAAGRQCRNAVARRREYLADPAGFERQALLLECLDSLPTEAEAAGDPDVLTKEKATRLAVALAPNLAREVLGDLAPDPAKRNLGVKTTTKAKALRLATRFASESRDRRKAARRLANQLRRRKLRREHRAAVDRVRAATARLEAQASS